MCVSTCPTDFVVSRHNVNIRICLIIARNSKKNIQQLTVSTTYTDKKAHVRKGKIVIAFNAIFFVNLAENSKFTFYCQNHFSANTFLELQILSTTLRWNGGLSNCTSTF